MARHGPDASHRMHRLIVCKHILISIISLVGTLLIAAAVPAWNTNFIHTSSIIKGDWPDAFLCVILCVAFLLHTLRIAGLFYKASVADTLGLVIVLEILLLVSLIPAVIFASWGGIFNFWNIRARTTSNGELLCSSMINVMAQECNPAIRVIGALELGGVVCGILVWAIGTISMLLERCYSIRARSIEDVEKGPSGSYRGKEEKHD